MIAQRIDGYDDSSEALRRTLLCLLTAAYTMGGLFVIFIDSAMTMTSTTFNALAAATALLFALLLWTHSKIWMVAASQTGLVDPNNVRPQRAHRWPSNPKPLRSRLQIFSADGVKAHPSFSLTLMVGIYLSGAVGLSLASGVSTRAVIVQSAAAVVAFALHLPARLAMNLPLQLGQSRLSDIEAWLLTNQDSDDDSPTGSR